MVRRKIDQVPLGEGAGEPQYNIGMQEPTKAQVIAAIQNFGLIVDRSSLWAGASIDTLKMQAIEELANEYCDCDEMEDQLEKEIAAQML